MCDSARFMGIRVPGVCRQLGKAQPGNMSMRALQNDDRCDRIQVSIFYRVTILARVLPGETMPSAVAVYVCIDCKLHENSSFPFFRPFSWLSNFLHRCLNFSSPRKYDHGLKRSRFVTHATNEYRNAKNNRTPTYFNGFIAQWDQALKASSCTKCCSS